MTCVSCTLVHTHKLHFIIQSIQDFQLEIKCGYLQIKLQFIKNVTQFTISEHHFSIITQSGFDNLLICEIKADGSFKSYDIVIIFNLFLT